MSKWSEVPLYHALTHKLSNQQDPRIISKAFKNIFGPSCLEQSSLKTEENKTFIHQKDK